MAVDGGLAVGVFAELKGRYRKKIYMYISTCMSLYMHVFIYTCVHVCTHVYVYIHGCGRRARCRSIR
jgi:hypothetical protein